MSTPTQWERAAHVVRSAGFGGSGRLADEAARVGVERWLATALGATADSDPGTRATPVPRFEAVERPGKDASIQERQQARQAARKQVTTLVSWWLRRMSTVQNPVGEKLTFGWHNHFATAATKVKSAGLLLGQNEQLRALGRGDFTTLTEAMIVDPALVYWLDGQKNTAKAPNENLARELMELFVLGIDGGYTEQDVKEAARSLTGWTIDRNELTLRFVPARHDNGSKTVLGTTANLDAKGLVRLLVATEASAKHVATRWWRLLASPTDPPAETLTRLTDAYGSSRDLKALFTAILTDPAYDAAAGTLVLSPVEWAVGALRALQVTTDDEMARKVGGSLRALGQLPFFPPNVSGWPAGQAWLSTASATTRAKFATALVHAGDLSAVEDAAPTARVEAATHLLGIPAVSARTAAELTKHTGDPRRLVAAALVAPENLVI